MTEQQRWHDASDRYLGAMLEWLRGRLHALAEPGERRSGTDSNRSGANGAALPAAPQPEADGGMPALVRLQRQLGLSDFELHTLLLCAAMEFDTHIGHLCAAAQGEPARAYPTFALALALFDEPAWDVLSPERPLRYWRLVEINQPGAQPLINSALKADERIVNYIKGLNYLDDRIAPLVTAVGRADTPLLPSQAEAATAIRARLRHRGGGAMPIVQLLGNDSHSKLAVASGVTAELGVTLHRAAIETLPSQTADQETFLRLWHRECALLPVALYIDALHVDRGGNEHAAAIQRMLRRSAGLTFLDARETWPELGRESFSIDIAKPTALEQQAVWAAELGAGCGAHAARLAGQFNLDAERIASIASDALALSAGDPNSLGATAWSTCVQQVRPSLDQLAQRLDPKATWDDIRLPAAEKSLLRQIAQQVKGLAKVYDAWGFRDRMNRGLGVSVLIAGESGTGKTMAAEVIANELRIDLFRIDLSSVVSKYIGETEKNLRRLFDAAEDGGAILFFDEADALFGKRSEVKDSHDRYANIEINYLLQRMEAYCGLAILATNMKSSLDSAFVRRLRFIVNFPFPAAAERKEIWERIFPSRVPLAGMDFQRLARFNLTGGSIHNIALNAAFLAAQAGSAVTMPVILEAVRNEFRKLEKPVNEADLRWLEPLGATA